MTKGLILSYDKRIKVRNWILIYVFKFDIVDVNSRIQESLFLTVFDNVRTVEFYDSLLTII